MSYLASAKDPHDCQICIDIFQIDSIEKSTGILFSYNTSAFKIDIRGWFSNDELRRFAIAVSKPALKEHRLTAIDGDIEILALVVQAEQVHVFIGVAASSVCPFGNTANSGSCISISPNILLPNYDEFVKFWKWL